MYITTYDTQRLTRAVAEVCVGAGGAELPEGLELDDWSMTRGALKILSGLVKRLKPRFLLEFGSGQSTRVLANAAGPSSVLTSIDHDPQFLETTRSSLKQTRYRCKILLLNAPLVLRSFGEEILPAYHLAPSVPSIPGPLDLVLIDGPPRLLGGRRGTLFQVMQLARPGTLVILDDAQRHSERQALKLWSETFEDAIEVLPTFAERFAFIIIKKVIPPEALAEYRLELLTRELKSVLQPNARVMVFDDNKVRGELDSKLQIADSPHTSEEADFPHDDEEAVSWLREACRSGSSHLVICWPSFWWLSTYPRFAEEVEIRGELKCSSSRVLVFELKRGA